MRRSFLSMLLMLITAISCTAQNVYVFAYFKGNGEDGLHLAYSKDGYKWAALKNDQSFLTPVVSKDKLMRDPCIIRGGDGLFHMVWTVSWNDKGIGYASSKDLIHWSQQEYVPLMEKEAGARNCWAPEITYDQKSGTYMIYWATTITGKYPETLSGKESSYNHRLYYVTTKDFKTYSPAKLLYEPGFNVIDATIVKEGKQYMMAIKDETVEPPKKNLRLAYSDELTGPYSKAGTPVTGNYWAEGPTVLQLGKDWLIYFDRYMDHHYGAILSSDRQKWTDVSDKISLPEGIRHGTIFTVSDKELQALL
jgi:beta-xylosidase